MGHPAAFVIHYPITLAITVEALTDVTDLAFGGSMHHLLERTIWGARADWHARGWDTR